MPDNVLQLQEVKSDFKSNNTHLSPSFDGPVGVYNTSNLYAGLKQYTNTKRILKHGLNGMVSLISETRRKVTQRFA